MRKIKVQENDSKQTLIKFLQKYLKGAPKSLIQKFIRKKRIKLNGKKAESSDLLEIGDIIDIYIYDEVIESWEKDHAKHTPASKINLDVAFENDDVVIVDKPSNLLSHAAEKSDYGNNVVDWLISYLIEKKDYIPRLENSFTPAIVNRLDRNTKGLIIGAKNRMALVYLNENIESELVEKYYLAIIDGVIKKPVEIVNYLEKDDNNVVRVKKDKSGKKSKTYIKPLDNNGKETLVEVKLYTGRTHQIRASLKDLGYSIKGDRKYGTRDDTFKNLMLVAYKLKFSKDIEIESLKGIEVESKYKEEILSIYHSL